MELVGAYRFRGILPRPETRAELAGILDEGSCPFCRRGRFRLVASHTVQKHGVSAQELRDMIGRGGGRGFTSEDEHHRRSVVMKRRMHDGTFVFPPRILGQKHRRTAADDLRRIRLQESVVARRKAHPCSVCGGTIPKGPRRTCSDECLRQRWHLQGVYVGGLVDPSSAAALALALANEARRKIPRIDHDTVCRRHRDGESAASIARSYGATKNTAWKIIKAAR